MNQWTEYAPASGWASFTRSKALTVALWDRLLPASWLYMNFTTGSSAWESRQDGSIVRAHYEGEQLAYFGAEAGTAGEFAELLAAEFELVRMPAQDAVPGAAPDAGGN